MFGFGKKKVKQPKRDAPEEIMLTEERKEELLSTISLKIEEVDQVAGEERAKIFEEIGLAYQELGEEDQAIAAFENSISAKKSIGAGYKALLKLYNQKRAQAAKANDEELLQVYLRKMDQMMQISKDVTRGVR
ncbi:tetratricopeptide repeat protein [Neobacillus drentensis]|uniref:tetratricopeptide repeat protein n=1 Tax=Neobacillus drentensis TaxID=220684 RepID=UPI003002604E